MYLNISKLTIHKDKDKDIIDLDVKQYTVNSLNHTCASILVKNKKATLVLMLALKHAWREPACPETDFILVCPEPGWVALFACGMAWPKSLCR